jgi:hypothetical protein
MLHRTYNAVVRYTLARTAEEVEEVFADLPATVGQGLAHELRIAGDVHRYDAEARRAYYFEMRDSSLAMWTWDEVHRAHEAGELIVLVVSSIAPLDEKYASEFYRLATGRSVELPWTPVGVKEAAD